MVNKSESESLFQRGGGGGDKGDEKDKGVESSSLNAEKRWGGGVSPPYRLP